MSIKRQIIELCNDMIIFWDGLEREIMKIPNQNEADIVYMWQEYFREHGDIVGTFSATKNSVNEVKEELIMNCELFIKH